MHVKFKIRTDHWGHKENYDVVFSRRRLMREKLFRKARGRYIHIGGAIQRNPDFKPLLNNGGK